MDSIKRNYYKFRIFLRNSFNTPEHIVEQKKYESLCVSVVQSLILDPNSVLIYTPKTFKYYIKNENLGVYVVMSDCMLSVTNHRYSYEIKITPKNERKLSRIFDGQLESRGEKFDAEMIYQIKESLSDIYNKISKNEQSNIKNSKEIS
jgi:hypothetical protein